MSPCFRPTTITVPETGPLHVRDPELDRSTSSTRRRKRYDNHSMSGKSMRPNVDTLRTKPTENDSARMDMYASLRNFRRRGMFPRHKCVYMGITSYMKLENVINKYFRDRPLTVSVDYEWSANYDPEDHP